MKEMVLRLIFCQKKRTTRRGNHFPFWKLIRTVYSKKLTKPFLICGSKPSEAKATHLACSVNLCIKYMVTRLVALASFIDVGVHSHTFTLDELSDQVKTTCKRQFTPSVNQNGGQIFKLVSVVDKGLFTPLLKIKSMFSNWRAQNFKLVPKRRGVHSVRNFRGRRD